MADNDTAKPAPPDTWDAYAAIWIQRAKNRYIEGTTEEIDSVIGNTARGIADSLRKELLGPATCRASGKTLEACKFALRWFQGRTANSEEVVADALTEAIAAAEPKG